MAQKSLIILACALLTLLTHPSVANDGIKEKFGKDLEMEINRYILEMVENVPREAEKFYQTILRELSSLTKGQTEMLRARLNRLNALEQAIAGKDKEKYSEALEELKVTHFHGITRMHSELNGLENNDRRLLENAIVAFNDNFDDIFGEFVIKMRNKYAEMFGKLSADDLRRHPEFERIHEKLRHLTDPDNNNPDFKSTMRAIIEFFGYTKYNEFLAA